MADNKARDRHALDTQVYLDVFEFETLLELSKALLHVSVEPLADALEHHQTQWNSRQGVEHAKRFAAQSTVKGGGGGGRML